MRGHTAIAALALALWCGTAVRAQVVPTALPPPASGPVGRALGNAALAIDRAALQNPTAATRAQFAYQSALTRLRMGDRVGALADASRAQALASAVASSSALAPVRGGSVAGSGFASGARQAPGASLLSALASAPLPSYITSTRNAVVRASGCRDERMATARLRDAIDSYVSGEATKARAQAKAATDIAARCRSTKRR